MVEGITAHFYFESLLSAVNIGIVIVVDAAAEITQSVRTEVHSLSI